MIIFMILSFLPALFLHRLGGAVTAGGRESVFRRRDLEARISFHAVLAHVQSADFFFAGDAAKPSGLVGLEHFGDVALLRSLVVAPDRRSRGEGLALLEHAERAARARGVKSLYLLTTTAENFFAKRGYVRVPRESAPRAIQATREFAGICPASSAFMCRNLD